jgi:hypothetical protein
MSEASRGEEESLSMEALESAILALRFLLELGVLVAVGYWGSGLARAHRPGSA